MTDDAEKLEVRSEKLKNFENGSGQRLAKAVGAFAILASAVSQEYGAGINVVLANSLGSYPRAAWLVPFAMFDVYVCLWRVYGGDLAGRGGHERKAEHA